MHDAKVRQHIVERVLARRGRYHIHDDELDPKTSAFVIIDMVNMFVEPGAPAEVPVSREIIDNINTANRELRQLGVKIIWITNAVLEHGGHSEWSHFLNHFIAPEAREGAKKWMAPDSHGQALWPDLEVEENDLVVTKNRYSALVPGSSRLDGVLRGMGIRNVLIGGTKTNVCCESTARDAMMLDFNVVMVEDCCAALSDEEHQGTLENVIQQFGDVMTAEEVLASMRRLENTRKS